MRLINKVAQESSELQAASSPPGGRGTQTDERPRFHFRVGGERARVQEALTGQPFWWANKSSSDWAAM